MTEKATVYITYAKRDIDANPAFLDSIIEALEAYGHDVWCDRLLKSHPEWYVQLFEQAVAREVFIALISENALNSHWVAREIDTARAGDAVILPIIIEDGFKIRDLEYFWLHLSQAYYYSEKLLSELPQMIATFGREVRDYRLEKATR